MYAFTREEAEIIVAVSATVEGARLNTEAVTFAARTLALASGAHPWKLGYLLDRLGVLTERGGYRRSIAGPWWRPLRRLCPKPRTPHGRPIAFEWPVTLDPLPSLVELPYYYF